MVGADIDAERCVCESWSVEYLPNRRGGGRTYSLMGEVLGRWKVVEVVFEVVERVWG